MSLPLPPAELLQAEVEPAGDPAYLFGLLLAALSGAVTGGLIVALLMGAWS